MRLIFIEHEFKLNDFNPWVQNTPHHIKELRQHFHQLKKLNILIENIQTAPVNSNVSTTGHDQTSSSNNTFRMHHHFRVNLLRAITYPQEPWSTTNEPKQTFESTIDVTIERLDQFSELKWENVLRYIVGATLIPYTKIDILEDSLQCIADNTEYEKQKNFLAQIDKHTDSAIKSFLKATALITEDLSLMQQLGNFQSQSQAQKLGYFITAKGYEYMLKDRSQQVSKYVAHILIILEP